MNNKDHRKLTFHLSLIIISLFAISCQNCNTTNADNKLNHAKDSTKKIIAGNYSNKDTISKAILLGKVVPAKDSNFAAVDQKYAIKKGNYLRKEAYTAFIKMYEAAKKDGVNLTILSATRTFNEQKAIWEGKWTGSTLYYGKNIATLYPDPVERSKYVLNYSSMPGTSRHHWGTDMGPEQRGTCIL